MIALTKGTVSWRYATALAPNEVEFIGTWVLDSDGHTPLMVWDAGLGNARAMTPAEVAALPAQRLSAARNTVSGLTTATLLDQPITALVRSVVLLALDEFNNHTATVNAILAAVAAATSLADLKTRMGLIANLPVRTKAQLLAAMTTKINAGDVDV